MCKGWKKSIKTYSWEDGKHADHPDPFVSIYLTIEEAGELTKNKVNVTFGSTAFKVDIHLPEERSYIFKRDALYDDIDPESSTWYLSKTKHRIVIKLAKMDAKKKWAGLTKVFAIVHHDKDALDYGLAALTGTTNHSQNQSKGSSAGHIVSSKREYWQGPPKYTWDKYDRLNHKS